MKGIRVMDLSQIKTEQRNERTSNIDSLSTIDMVRLINSEDKKVAEAVEKELEHIAEAVDLIADRLSIGGRLVYMGSGTSGRLGILDAVECPPTYSTEPEQVIGLIAGGYPAIFKAQEGAEDSTTAGIEDLQSIGFCEKDVLVGVSASGRTPYVVSAMKYAESIGAEIVSVTCSPDSEMEKLAHIAIVPQPGPEVVTGSTRMKSGSAQKMVLNMLSTGAMIKLGKVYGNLMVDVKPSNEKLVHRCRRIVSDAAGVTEDEAAQVLEKCEYKPKIAILMILCGYSAEEAKAALENHGGRISGVIAGV